MSISTALQTAFSGIKAQSYAIGNISGNIANAHTPGYKAIETSFSELIAAQSSEQTMAGSVVGAARQTISLQGPLKATGVPTNMAISGEGFFTVQQRTGDAKFSGTTMFTRRGDFTLKKDGYLVNGADAYLFGTNLDPATGGIVSSGPIKIANATMPGRQTTRIDYGANLPKPSPGSGSEGQDTSPYTVSSAIVTDPTLTSPDMTKRVTAAQVSGFLNKSLVGPSLTVYAAGGGAVPLSTRWARVQDADPAATPPKNTTWNLFYSSTATTSKTGDWINTGSAFAFDSSGRFIPPATATVAADGNTSLKIPQVVIDGMNLGDITLNLGVGRLTNGSTSSPGVTTNTLSQDGYAAGSLKSVSVTPEGTIVGTFSNEMTAPLATAGLASFANPNGLKAVAGGHYVQTRESGAPMAGLQTASIVGGNIEGSNSDIAGEFSKLIATQQAYSANVKVMTSSQQMMTELLNAIR
ncbi:flagellar biosynthesis protein FlgE [Rhodoplanes elegans]|uniref:Flagellar hook protein FlgE n=2 Tax=Rhodoplanes elegans TaxID=29408 RepID=A0A327KV83_9BRAD|nr:flagellar hook-basal body complex protein [Rhodoplanes elegans]MBK5959264.1 flagellar biosynthesis protein FlgE [Rhodoplanes elegans]RAI42191.1 flagellar biosynthesis protein FlgE [Rhodoplanes elegans]